MYLTRLLPGLFPPTPSDIDAAVRRVVLWLLLGLIAVGLVAAASVSDGRALSALVVAGVGTLAAGAVPWHRFHRDAFAVFCAFVIVWLAWWVFYTGGTESRQVPITFIAVATCALTLSRSTGFAMGSAAAATAALPLVYQSGLGVAQQQEVAVRTAVLVLLAIGGAWLTDEVRRAVDTATIDRTRLLSEQELTSELRRTQDQRTEYLSVLAHELRNPLTGINAAARVLAREISGQAGELTARGIATESRHAMDLLDGLTDVASLESGRMRLALRPMDLTEVVREAADTSVSEHTVALRSSGEPLIVLGDDRRLGQVIRNLVSNAAKYSPAGAEIQLSLGVSADRRNAIVQVRDEGPGIPPPERSRLFQKFQRLSTAGGTRGSGLGLYISRGIVNDHGGEMWADWPAGGGSVFSFSIPLAESGRVAPVVRV